MNFPSVATFGAIEWAIVAFATVAAYFIIQLVYNIFLHPLRAYPGPLANRASVIPKAYHLLKGDLPYYVADILKQYGPAARIAPNELAFTDPRAWRDIYTRKSHGQHELPHYMGHYNVLNLKNVSVLNSAREEHDHVRKLLSHGFSERAMRAQEPTIGGCVDLLMQRLRERAVDAEGNLQAINICDWMTYTTFDIIGSLAFGSSFGCLEESAYHPWISIITGNLKNIAFIQVLNALGILRVTFYIMQKFKVGDKSRQLHQQLTIAKTKQRLEMGVGRDDFLDGLIKSGMNFEQLKSNAGLLIIAGSETTATLLTGAVFLLTTHTDVLEKLTLEVRSQFKDESEITMDSVRHLTYMLAVLNEALRFYPPLAITAPRVVPPGGAEIAGCAVPEGTVVGVWHLATSHDPKLFANPDRFDPDRFAKPGQGEYANDRLDAVNPFLLGPRNCIGQTLAYAEMRLILACLIWGFDMSLSEQSKGWLKDQKNFLLWEKPVLDVYLKPVKR